MTKLLDTTRLFPATLCFDGIEHPVIDMPVSPKWAETAAAKGFDIICRARDRYHLVLRCRTCGALNLVKIFTLMSAQPICQVCQTRQWAATAEAAGAFLLRRCPKDRHYAWLLMPCGHAVRRQMELVGRAARGEAEIRCETCLAEREAAEAEAQGWRLIGADPEGNPNYRLYAHEECGHVQRVARANMQTGRFNCAKCGEGWSAAPSAIYLLDIRLPCGRKLLKFGMSRNTLSRVLYQLPRHEAVRIEILDSVPMPSGHQAQLVEKKIHARLRLRYPAEVVDPADYAAHLKVRSEVYTPRLERRLRRELSRIRRKFPPLAEAA
jgi:hypothetical protein